MRSTPKVRIQLEDNIMSAIMKLGGGNPGALTTLMDLVRNTSVIDPDDIFGGFGALMHLDSFGIYESRIWMLYSDVCDKDLTKVMTLLRGVQLGILSRDQLNKAIDGDNGYGDPKKLPITFANCLTEVQKIAKQFAVGTVFTD